jgi:IstB-like ATP binding protein
MHPAGDQQASATIVPVARDCRHRLPVDPAGVRAARRGQRVAFATAHQWVNRLGAAKRAGRLDEELERLGRIPLLIVDEVGYIPFDPEAALPRTLPDRAGRRGTFVRCP